MFLESEETAECYQRNSPVCGRSSFATVLGTEPGRIYPRCVCNLKNRSVLDALVPWRGSRAMASWAVTAEEDSSVYPCVQ